MPSYDARMIPDSSVIGGPIREHCMAHRSQITTRRRNKGQQVRRETVRTRLGNPFGFRASTHSLHHGAMEPASVRTEFLVSALTPPESQSVGEVVEDRPVYVHISHALEPGSPHFKKGGGACTSEYLES